MAGAKALPPSLRDSLKTRISPDAYHPVERMSRTGRKLFGLQSRQWTAPTSAGRTTACHAAAAQLVEPSKLRADVPRPERQIATVLDHCALAIATEDEPQELPDRRIQRLSRRDIHDGRDDSSQRVPLRDQRLYSRQDIGSRRGRRQLDDPDRRVGKADV